jgi:phospholipase/carboxylesterase
MASLHYLIQEPKVKKDKNPLLLLLHGYGSNEEDLFSFASELPDDCYVISSKAPYPLQPYGNAWYAIHFDADQNKFSDDEQAIKSRDLVVTFIDELCDLHDIDKEYISLIGFSQGSILSFSIALSYPHKIKNVVALSGYLNTNLVKKTPLINTHKVNYFIAHGTQDQVIPVDWARKTIPFMEAYNQNFEYNEYPIGHGVSPKVFMDFKNWLSKN